MSDRFTQDQAVDAVATLTISRLTAFVEAEIVTPMQTPAGPVYRQLDLVRMELLCELSDEFGMENDALGVVMSLIDQLHDARSDLRAVLRAIENEPEAVRQRIAEALRTGA
jgi:chaperone modulatory protein CbpM